MLITKTKTGYRLGNNPFNIMDNPSNKRIITRFRRLFYSAETTGIPLYETLIVKLAKDYPRLYKYAISLENRDEMEAEND